jgi:hypothetical protein
MAKVSGIKEKLHLPLYDAIFVPGQKDGMPAKRLVEVITDPWVLRFFVDVQDKTRLETNLQEPGALPSLSHFEAHGMRVVVSSLDDYATQSDEKDDTLDSQNGTRFLAGLIYNSVTTLLVGEKTMIEAPTFLFPAGTGVHSPRIRQTHIMQHYGEPDHLNTFRFAEPVIIEPQQNFRVEMSFPRGLPPSVTGASGPYHIWVVLDGYLVRNIR